MIGSFQAGESSSDHFADIGKKAELGSDAERKVQRKLVCKEK